MTSRPFIRSFIHSTVTTTCNAFSPPFRGPHVLPMHCQAATVESPVFDSIPDLVLVALLSQTCILPDQELPQLRPCSVTLNLEYCVLKCALLAAATTHQSELTHKASFILLSGRANMRRIWTRHKSSKCAFFSLAPSCWRLLAIQRRTKPGCPCRVITQ